MVTTTLKKISEALGVSVSTVSRALKNHPDISESTKKKIQELATILDYEPNANAINLRTKNTKVFGLMVPSITNFFYHSFISSVEEESRKNGYSVMILQTGNDPAMEIENLKICRQNRITGLFACISPDTYDIQQFLRMEDLEIPVIFFDKVPHVESCNRISVNDEAAAVLAAKTLLQKKKKDILAIFGNPNLSITKKRLQAFTELMNNDSSVKLKIEHASSSEEAEKITASYYKKKKIPDALFCMSDEILTGSMKAFLELKINYPANTGIVTMSNGFFPNLYYPEITYVETSGYKLGKLAYTRMLACINGSTFVQEMSVDPVLVSGKSL